MQKVQYCKFNSAASDGDLNTEGHQPFCEAERPATHVPFAARRQGGEGGLRGKTYQARDRCRIQIAANETSARPRVLNAVRM